MPEIPVVQYEPGEEYSPVDGDWDEAIIQAVGPPEPEPELTPEQVTYLEFLDATDSQRENFASTNEMSYSISVGEVCRFDEFRRHVQVAPNCPHGIGRKFREEYGAPQRAEPDVPHVRHWRRYGSI